MKKLTILLIVLLLISGCTKNRKEFTVGVIQWGEHPALVDSFEGMKEGLLEKGILERTNIEVKNAYEDASNALTISSQFVQADVDVIYAIATPSAQAAMNVAEESGIPIIFSAVSDPIAAGLLKDTENPEGQITGVSDLPPLEKQIKLIKEIMLEHNRIGVLYNTSEINSIKQIEMVEKFARKEAMQVVTKGVSSPSELSQAASQLSQRSDLMYIINDNMVASATGLVVDQFNKQGKPVFMAEDGQMNQGVLASDSVSYLELGRQAGTMIASLLLEEKVISEIPIERANNTKLSINKDVAESLSIEIPIKILERVGK